MAEAALDYLQSLPVGLDDAVIAGPSAGSDLITTDSEH